ncbi:hypothetical protein NST02_23425 [Robertmurraya sp. FSL W8-0741]|uniref:hypothetical protein n=1 Tax=Robertmurraya sp. FSL W8-0741 TaxID=2954629 RepID=UPI0030F7F058
MSMIGEVTVWYMTEEERLAYIEKHPIKPTEKPKGTSFGEAAAQLSHASHKPRWGYSDFSSKRGS